MKAHTRRGSRASGNATSRRHRGQFAQATGNHLRDILAIELFQQSLHSVFWSLNAHCMILSACFYFWTFLRYVDSGLATIAHMGCYLSLVTTVDRPAECTLISTVKDQPDPRILLMSSAEGDEFPPKTACKHSIFSHVDLQSPCDCALYTSFTAEAQGQFFWRSDQHNVAHQEVCGDHTHIYVRPSLTATLSVRARSY